MPTSSPNSCGQYTARRPGSPWLRRVGCALARGTPTGLSEPGPGPGSDGLGAGLGWVVVVSVVEEAGIGKSRYAIRGRLCKRQGAVGGARAVI